MRLHVTLACLLVLLGELIPSSVVTAQPAERVELGARVIDLDRTKLRATIDRGRQSGLSVGDTGELFRLTQDASWERPDSFFEVPLGTAKVVTVSDRSATVALDGGAGGVEAGAYFLTTIQVSPVLARSPLYRVTALGVELAPAAQDRPFITFDALRADASGRTHDRALAAMLADIKAARDVMASIGRVEGGPYHGKEMAHVFDQVSRAELERFLGWVDGIAGKYVAKRERLVLEYATWIAMGAPSGDTQRKLRWVRPTIAAARKAVAAGKLEDARKHWAAVLREVPDSVEASDTVPLLDRCLAVLSQLTSDPDDTGARFRLVQMLFDVSAFELALTHAELLRKQRYESEALDDMHSLLLVELGRWSPAVEAYTRLVQRRPGDQVLARKLAYVRAEAAAARSSDLQAQLAVGVAAIERERWDRAIQALLAVRDAKSASPAQRSRATLALEQIGVRREAEDLKWQVRVVVESRDHRAVQTKLDELAPVLARVDDGRKRHEVIAELANHAQGLGDDELAIELWTKLAAGGGASAADLADLANRLLQLERVAEATDAIQRSLALDKDEPFATLVDANLAYLRGELDVADARARRAVALSPRSPWARLQVARVAAERDDWPEAITQLRTAADLSDAFLFHRALAAAQRGLEAKEALVAPSAPPRERLRLVRALGALGVYRRVATEVARLPRDGTWRAEGWWALAESAAPLVPLAERITAAQSANPTSPLRKRVRARFEATRTLRANPSDDRARVELARLYLHDQQFDRCLATLAPLLSVATVRRDVSDLANDARTAIAMTESIDRAYALGRREDYAGALALTRPAMEAFDRLGIMRSQMAARNAHAVLLSQQGRHAEAIALAESTRKIVAADGDAFLTLLQDRTVAQRRAPVDLGESLRQRLAESITLCTSLDLDECLQLTHRELAEVSHHAGLIAEAVEHGRKAWTFADRLGRPALARDARVELVGYHLSAGRIADAERLGLELLAHARTHGDVDVERRVLVMLGAVAFRRGQGALARARAREVYDIGTRTGVMAPRALARRLEAVAWLRADHDPSKAATAFEQAATLYATMADAWSEFQRGLALQGLAEARLEARQLAAARAAADASLVLARQFQRPAQLARTHYLLAMIALADGKSDEALSQAQTAVTTARQTDSHDVLVDAHYALARAHEATGNDKLAREAYDQAVEHLGFLLLAAGGSALRDEVAGSASVRDVFRHAIQHYLKLGLHERAMEVLELSRDAQLKQAIDPSLVRSSDAKVQTRLDSYQAARARVRALQRQLDDAQDQQAARRDGARIRALSQEIARTRKQLQALLDELKRTHPQVYRGLAIAPDQLAARRQQLAKDTALVEYFVTSDRLYAFIITPATARPSVVSVKVSSADLAHTVSAYRSAILQENEKVRARDQVAALGRKLDGWLLAPLRPHLTGVTTLVMIPYGPLHQVPFDALVVSPAGKPVRYALEDFRISLQSTTTMEALLAPVRPRNTGAMLAIANADGSLPGATREVNRLVKTRPDARVLGKGQATLAQFGELASSYVYLHIATHGILDPDPRKNYLKLSDGDLTIERIAELGLDRLTDLVVLSACDSAMEEGRSDDGELLSLAVGFALAGAPAVVASLWEVSDDSTAELMVTFYRELEKGAGDRLDALRNAKLALMRLRQRNTTPYAEPWHWAAFQLYGDYRVPTTR